MSEVTPRDYEAFNARIRDLEARIAVLEKIESAARYLKYCDDTNDLMASGNALLSLMEILKQSEGGE